MSEYTPGPWLLKEPSSPPFKYTILAPDFGDECIVSAMVVAWASGQKTFEECLDARYFAHETQSGIIAMLERQRADMRLITASPNLLEALRPFAHFARMLKLAPMGGVGDDLYVLHSGTEYEARLTRSALDDALAAIAKAEGK